MPTSHDPHVATASNARPPWSAAPPDRVGRLPLSLRRRTALALAYPVLALLLVWIGSSIVKGRASSFTVISPRQGFD